MLFKFQKYIQPIFYFNLKKKNGKTVYPKIESVPQYKLNIVDKDDKYSNIVFANYDMSIQLVLKGYLTNGDTYNEENIRLSIYDEYRFLRRFYNPVWSYYVLILRLFCLNNPIKEIVSFWKNINTEKIDLFKTTCGNDEWEEYCSTLIKNNVKISVIIPTLNRYSFLKNILNDLEKQTYKNFEVVIIDQSEPFNKDFYNEYSLEINSIYQEEKALWLARNTGVKVSKSDYVLFCEDDIRVPIQWIENHIKALDFFNAEISTGVFFPEFSQIPKQSNFFRIAEQFSSGNALVKKSIFKYIGLFDRQFEKQRMGDAEFGMRAYLEGFLSISNPYAYCEDVKAPIGGLRQMGSWDAFRPKSFFSPRPIPSVLYYYRKYFGNKTAILSLMKNIPPSLIPYKYKRNSKLLVIGSFTTIIIAPLIFLQVIISWKKSTIKLKQGNKIEFL